ncbi:MAG: hypothetical protein Q9221_007972 [Calogaya cf. arnoldii]
MDTARHAGESFLRELDRLSSHEANSALKEFLALWLESAGLETKRARLKSIEQWVRDKRYKKGAVQGEEDANTTVGRRGRGGRGRGRGSRRQRGSWGRGGRAVNIDAGRGADDGEEDDRADVGADTGADNRPKDRADEEDDRRDGGNVRGDRRRVEAPKATVESDMESRQD